jgi:DNA-binding transcriptional MerR regulator
LANYSIRDLEKLSGIKAHTIRIWEQRYHFIEPRRSATNIRYYTDEDLQYLLNVAFLNRNGLRISKISKMSRIDISKKVASISQDSLENSNQLQALTMAMIELNEDKFEHTLKAAIDKEGFDQVLSGIILPFLEKLSLLWLTGSISAANEQFINHLIRQKIAVHSEALPIPDAEAAALRPKAILFEPFADEQELMLTLVNYLFRSKGCKTMYLGKGINLKNLSAACSAFHPNCFYVMLSEGNSKNNPQDFLIKLGQEYPELQIIVNSKAVLKTHLLPDNIVILENFSEFMEFLEEIE